MSKKTEFQIPGDLHYVGKLKFKTSEQALSFLDEVEKSVAHSTQDKIVTAIRLRMSEARRILADGNLQSAAGLLSEINIFWHELKENSDRNEKDHHI